MMQTGMSPTDVADELAEEFTRLSGPATEEQINAAEHELGVVFPAFYRNFLLRFGAGRLKWLDVFGIPRNCLWGDIVMMNQLAPVKIPAGCILFARDVRGAFYCLECAPDRATEESPVIRVSLPGKQNQVAGSIAEFFRDVARS